MKIKQLATSLIIFLIGCSSVDCAASSGSGTLTLLPSRKVEKKEKIASFPMKDLGNSHLAFEIPLPGNFELKSVVPQSETSKLLEYMPIGTKDPAMWSELINVIFSPRDINLSEFWRKYKDQCESEYKNDKNFHMTSSFGQTDGFPVGVIKIDKIGEKFGVDCYKKAMPGTREFEYVKQIKGLGGFVIVQYFVRYSENASEEEKGRIRAKMDAFLDSCKVILKHTKPSFQVPE